MHTSCNSTCSAYNSLHYAFAACREDITAHTVSETAHIDDVIAHKEYGIDYIAHMQCA